MTNAAAALASDRPAQISMIIRKPNTNASPTDSLMAALVLASRPMGACKPASLISFA